MAGGIKPITMAAVIFFLVAAVAPLFVPSMGHALCTDPRQKHRGAGHHLAAAGGTGFVCSLMFFTTGAYAAAFWGKYVGGGDIMFSILCSAPYRPPSSASSWACLWCATGKSSSECSTWPSRWYCGRYWRRCSTTPTVRTVFAWRVRVCWDWLSRRKPFQYVILYVSLLIAVAAFFGVQRYLDSPLGHMLRAIKSNETRLEYLGTSARRVLLIGYVISAFLGGVGGALVVDHSADRHAGVRLLDQVGRVRVHRDPRRRRACVRRVRRRRHVRDASGSTRPRTSRTPGSSSSASC